MSTGLSGMVAVVTGATAGVGLAISTSLAERGVRVVGTGRREALGKSVESDLRAAGGDFTFVRSDVTDAADCARTVAAVVEQFGRIDILINNVGVSTPIRRVEDTTDEIWNGIVGPTLLGTFYMVREVIPVMRAQEDGVIINIASVGALQAIEAYGAYGGAKAAVLQLSRTIAVENLDKNVRSNAIVLGAVPSEQLGTVFVEMNTYKHGPDWTPPSEEEMAAAGAAVPGLMDPTKVGNAVAHLCHPDAAPITGATIEIDRCWSTGWLSSQFFYTLATGVG